MNGRISFPESAGLKGHPMKDQLFPYRGLMLDSARHFIPVEEMKKLIKAAGICGMNRLHWHLTDDQGWRIEIRRYPKLGEIGSVRGRSFFGGVSETENNDGFYTQEEIREIVRFAGEEGMEVIPEIDIPGHASALLSAYPEYGCRSTAAAEGESPNADSRDFTVEKGGGIFPNLICAGKESSIRFLEGILDEVMDLFPCRMIHLGGDEALKLRWRRCPDCQRKMSAKGLKDEDDLQRDLILQIGEYLAARGRETVVWNDVLNGGTLPPHFIVQQWMSGEDQTRQFMRNGGRVICSDHKVYYFDHPYGSSDIRKIWQYPRIPDWAEGYENQLLGLECPLWSERITNTDTASFLLFPRLAAAGLKAQADIPWHDFLTEIRKTHQRIQQLGLRCAPEEMWDMTEEKAAADRQADLDRKCAPEAQPYLLRTRRLVLLEKTERFMRQIGIPEGLLLHAGDRILSEPDGKPKNESNDGAEKLILQLMDAVQSRESGPWNHIPEKIWLDTMKCFPRFIAEYRRSFGTDGFDRGEWTVRQTECRLFRIGELEYELLEENGKQAVSLHIPSDTRLESDLLNDSVRQAKEFLGLYFPDWKKRPMICHSWLLSPKLKDLLPPESRILRFQAAFDLTDKDPEDMAALEWVFYIPERLQASVQMESLPETTSLQRKMKSMLLAGEKPGSARGILTRAFR